MSLDPLKYCKQYREKGCCHVDGFLCNVKICEGSGYKNGIKTNYR